MNSFRVTHTHTHTHASRASRSRTHVHRILNPGQQSQPEEQRSNQHTRQPTANNQRKKASRMNNCYSITPRETKTPSWNSPIHSRLRIRKGSYLNNESRILQQTGVQSREKWEPTLANVRCSRFVIALSRATKMAASSNRTFQHQGGSNLYPRLNHYIGCIRLNTRVDFESCMTLQVRI